MCHFWPKIPKGLQGCKGNFSPTIAYHCPKILKPSYTVCWQKLLTEKLPEYAEFSIFLQCFRRFYIASARHIAHRNLYVRWQCNNFLKLHAIASDAVATCTVFYLQWQCNFKKSLHCCCMYKFLCVTCNIFWQFFCQKSVCHCMHRVGGLQFFRSIATQQFLKVSYIAIEGETLLMQL